MNPWTLKSTEVWHGSSGCFDPGRGWQSLSHRVPMDCKSSSGNQPPPATGLPGTIVAEGPRKMQIVIYWKTWECDGMVTPDLLTTHDITREKRRRGRCGVLGKPVRSFETFFKSKNSKCCALTILIHSMRRNYKVLFARRLRCLSMCIMRKSI